MHAVGGALAALLTFLPLGAGVLLLAAVCFSQRPAASPAHRRSPACDGVLLAREATKPILLQRCYANKKSLNLAISYILLSGHVFFKQD